MSSISFAIVNRDNNLDFKNVSEKVIKEFLQAFENNEAYGIIGYKYLAITGKYAIFPSDRAVNTAIIKLSEYYKFRLQLYVCNDKKYITTEGFNLRVGVGPNSVKIGSGDVIRIVLIREHFHVVVDDDKELYKYDKYAEIWSNIIDNYLETYRTQIKTKSNCPLYKDKKDTKKIKLTTYKVPLKRKCSLMSALAFSIAYNDDCLDFKSVCKIVIRYFLQAFENSKTYGIIGKKKLTVVSSECVITQTEKAVSIAINKICEYFQLCMHLYVCDDEKYNVTEGFNWNVGVMM